MRGARTVAVGIAALAASLAITLAVEAAPRGMVNVPAGLYKPFLKEKALNDGGKAAALTRRVDAFRLDVEPVTNAEFLAFVAEHPSGASRGSRRCLPMTATSSAGRPTSSSPTPQTETSR
jgi:formylglycine-generating enzyme required for sulfatase activity